MYPQKLRTEARLMQRLVDVEVIKKNRGKYHRHNNRHFGWYVLFCATAIFCISELFRTLLFLIL